MKRTLTRKKRAGFMRESFRINRLAFQAKRATFRAKRVKRFEHEQSVRESCETFHLISLGTFLIYKFF